MQNKLIQLLTGEGKSIILGLLSTFFAFIGYTVDVVCYSPYLSKRDKKSFKELFIELGVEKKIEYSTITKLCEKIVNSKGDIRKMTENLFINKSTIEN